MKIVISAGHGLLVRGAEGIIDEVDEARRVVPAVADWMRKAGHSVIEFYDDDSTTQQQNLDAIINFHNSQVRDLDISVHFNANEPTDQPVGTEVLYVTQEALAARVAEVISVAGDLKNRGAKYRDDLAFLNGCDQPAILIEVAFVDSEADVIAYTDNFAAICAAIGSMKMEPGDDTRPSQYVTFTGTCSWFGGPDDTGVSPSEGLAFIYEYSQAPHLFLEKQPAGTTGLARRLDPDVPYVACRWDYSVTPKTMLDDKDKVALVKATKTGRMTLAWPADWGPHEEQTGRAADLSPGLMYDLGIDTDDEVMVMYPVQLPANLLVV